SGGPRRCPRSWRRWSGATSSCAAAPARCSRRCCTGRSTSTPTPPKASAASRSPPSAPATCAGPADRDEGGRPMPKQGEIEYMRRIGEGGRWYAANKPFAVAGCAVHLMDVGAILSLLPPAPARLLDLGCGTGWTCAFFARCGYEVVGQDIAPD